jgi:ABC-type sugar transport system ATPase subunit
LKAVGLGSLFAPWLGLPSTALVTVASISVGQFVGIPLMLIYASLLSQINSSTPLGSTVSGTCAAVTIGVRPEHLMLSAEGDFATAGVVELVERPGEASYAHVRRADDKMTVAEIRGRRTPLPDERVQLSASVTDIHVFDAEGHRVAAGS